ncbi:jg4069 [Pararge aegeria aegeria]|uniref:Jg4069 protein n=1 Tax=Pararge aegeria aegeria TaxID=348720 RepID=A0A8S4QR54_9NEOP|nr:jg4069 [Pararge aegeria aegeria]
MEIVMPGVSLRHQIRNEEVRRRTRVTDISSESREAEVAMGEAHSTENRWTLGWVFAAEATGCEICPFSLCPEYYRACAPRENYVDPLSRLSLKDKNELCILIIISEHACSPYWSFIYSECFLQVD